MKPVDAASKVDAFLSRFMPLVPISGLVLGVSFPDTFRVIAPYGPWLFGTMTLSGALKLKASDIGKAASSPLNFVLYFAVCRILLPLVVLGVSRLVFTGDPDIVAGFVLVYAVPTAVSSFVWVTIFKGDIALVLAFILMDTILAPFLTPFTVRVFLGTAISIDIMGMALSLVYMIVIPTIIGISLNEFSKGKVPEVINPWLSPLSKLIMTMVIAGNSALVAHLIRPDNPVIWIIFAVCVCLNIFAFIFGKFIAKTAKMDDDKQTAFFLATGLRNNSAAMVLGIQFFPPAAVLAPVLGIISQHTLAGLIGKFLVRKGKEDEN